MSTATAPTPATTTRTWPLAACLATFTDSWEQLFDISPTRSSTGIGGGSDDARLPGGTERLSLAEAITRFCAYWTRAVLDEHACATTALHASDVPAMATWLRDHVDWIEAQPEAPEELALASDLARHLASLLAPSGVRRPIVGACPHDDGGRVRARLGAEHDERDLVCDVDPDHRWDEHSWRDLGAALGHISPTEPERMRPEELAAWLTRRFGRTITRANIDLWKHRYPWFPRPDDQGTYDRIRVTEWMIERAAA